MVKQLKSMNPGMRLIVASLWRKHLIWERKGTNYLCCPGPQKLRKTQHWSRPRWWFCSTTSDLSISFLAPFKIQGFNALWPAIFAAGTLKHIGTKEHIPNIFRWPPIQIQLSTSSESKITWSTLISSVLSSSACFSLTITEYRHQRRISLWCLSRLPLLATARPHSAQHFDNRFPTFNRQLRTLTCSGIRWTKEQIVL